MALNWSVDDVLRSISEAEGLDDKDEFSSGVITFNDIPNVKTAIGTMLFNLNRNIGRKAKVKLANLVVNHDRSGKADIKYYTIINYKWVEQNASLSFVSTDAVSDWLRKLTNIVLDAANLLPSSPRDEDEIEDDDYGLSESLDDTDKFADKDEQYWHRTFQSLYDEGGLEHIAYAINTHFPPMHAVDVNVVKNYIVMAGYDGSEMLGPRMPATELATKKFIVGFDWDQQLENWLHTRLSIKLNAIDHAFASHTIKDNPFLFEALDDADTFGEENWWGRTFQSLIDEGGIEQVSFALRSAFPSDNILEVGEDYVVMAVTITNSSHSGRPRETNLRKIKFGFEPNQTLSHWLRKTFIPRVRELEDEKEPLSPDSHPLFFEDLSPWGNEMGKPWGWQALVVPVHEAQISPAGGALDDADEFMTGDDNWTVTVTNKNIPGKELAGVVGWERGETTGHFPKVFGVEKNDFGISSDFAQKIIWAAYWQAEETTGGRTSYEPFELDTYLVDIGRDGEELLKYINDPEHYGKQYPDKQLGWKSVGTHTYEESANNAFTVTLGSRPFTKLHEVDLINIQMGAWHWPNNYDTRRAPGASDFLYSDAETIMNVYSEMFIWWAPAIGLQEFYDQQDEELPAHEGPDLDDRDEFEIDDPEVDLQRWTDAERLGATAARDRMVQESQTLIAEMKPLGLELLFVGAGPGIEHKRELRPFIIIGRKTVTEGLDDKDEFAKPRLCSCSAGEVGGEHAPWCEQSDVLEDQDEFETDQPMPFSTTIIYPKTLALPSEQIIEIAKMIVVEHGYMPGEFTTKKQIEYNEQIRIFGTLEVNGALIDELEHSGGQVEMISRRDGQGITIIFESEDIGIRHLGIDA